MEPDTLIPAGDFGGALSQADLTLIVVGAVLLRAIPILIAISALIKLRRFPALRPLHTILLVDLALIAALALIDTLAPGLVPNALRTSGLWSFLWIFAIAWLVVTWTRSAIKTRMRPRVLDIATLVTVAAMALALLLPMAGVV